jgi:hypothetical protein
VASPRGYIASQRRGSIEHLSIGTQQEDGPVSDERSFNPQSWQRRRLGGSGFLPPVSISGSRESVISPKAPIARFISIRHGFLRPNLQPQTQRLEKVESALTKTLTLGYPKPERRRAIPILRCARSTEPTGEMPHSFSRSGSHHQIGDGTGGVPLAFHSAFVQFRVGSNKCGADICPRLAQQRIDFEMSS